MKDKEKKIGECKLCSCLIIGKKLVICSRCSKKLFNNGLTICRCLYCEELYKAKIGKEIDPIWGKICFDCRENKTSASADKRFGSINKARKVLTYPNASKS